jgi:hypothetical protein
MWKPVLQLIELRVLDAHREPGSGRIGWHTGRPLNYYTALSGLAAVELRESEILVTSVISSGSGCVPSVSEVKPHVNDPVMGQPRCKLAETSSAPRSGQ